MDSPLRSFDLCVVGSGFFGAVIARQAAEKLGKKVLVIERRSHIGGNSFSDTDPATGIEVHRYGSHIFHTNDREVWEYVSRFTQFNHYRHRVLTTHQGKIFSMPINLGTINQFYNKSLSPSEAATFIASEIKRDAVAQPRNLEEKAISLIGRPLYEAFIKGYSQKQWETELTSLPASIITRLPVRFSYNDRYFDDVYEGIPIGGYGAIFRKMLDHPLISVRLQTDFFDLKAKVLELLPTVYTGPIDRFFDFKHGRLGWRTLDFEQQTFDVADYQGTSVMNYADGAVPFTRIHEFKHFHPERDLSTRGTVIYREYSRTAHSNDEPYYPINTELDKRVLERYQQEAATLPNVIFGGRLATYKYLDMHQVIGAALVTFDRRVVPLLSKQHAASIAS